MTYQPPEVATLADEFAGLAYEYLQSVQPGWVANDGDPFTILTEAVSLPLAEAAERLSLTAEALTETSATLHGIPRLDAVAATIQATYTLSDSAGHVIDGGSTVVITTAAGVESLWQVQSDVTVAAGSSATAAGQVTLVAVEAGADGNGVNGAAEVVSPRYTWVASIGLVGAASGGRDQEPYADFLDRATRELTSRSGLIIKADQLAIRALSVPGVGRALAIRTYNPVGPDDDAPGHMTVALMDEDGGDVAADVSAAVEALPAADGVTLHAVDFDDHEVDVAATVVKYDDWDSATVKADCELALAAFLSPLAWGETPTGELQQMTVESTVRLDEVASVLYRVPGVRWVDFSTVELAVDGGTLAASDAALTGDFPVTRPGTPTVTVT